MAQPAAKRLLLREQPALLAALLLVMHAGSAEDIEGPVQRGALVYQKYCVVCHGKEAHGDGRAAALQEARPADLTQSRRTDAYKAEIIRLGGAALGRSKSMPPWSDQLSEAEIQDVVRYLRTLVRVAPSGAR